jgi:hypothetical protein
MPAKLRGAQTHQLIKRSEWFQGFGAAQGFRTVLPYQLRDYPQSARAVKFFFGTYVVTDADPSNLSVPPTISGSQARLACLGTDFDVDMETRKLIWLPTARWPLLATYFVVIDYYTEGYTA